MRLTLMLFNVLAILSNSSTYSGNYPTQLATKTSVRTDTNTYRIPLVWPTAGPQYTTQCSASAVPRD